MSIKFPLKFFSGFVPEPYIMAAYPLRFPSDNDVFVDYPMLAYGGGVQFAVKLQKSSALFLEVGYLYYGDVTMKNPYVLR
ncbi:hypothetical protein, partial [Treponema sp. R6D11]